ncbi:hypothetical protein LA080_009696 [Diaporthe eres]|nr:hypothetical protein LA080_009696 [Diaporthe eres]
MTIVENVKFQHGRKRHWWSSARKALRQAWKLDVIARIEQRIASVQRTIVFRICTLSSPIVEQTLKDVEALRDQANSLSVKWASELSSIQETATDIQHRLADFRSSGVQPNLSQLDIHGLLSKILASSERAKGVEQEYDILTSLNYEHREARLGTIPVAHERTFRLIFDRRNNNQGAAMRRSQERFSQWLSQKSSIFWVTGKPGSGKSTLMKYIANHPQTRESLAALAAPKTVVLASHYFWSPGTTMQKCYEGLLRSILMENWTTTELLSVLTRVAGFMDLPHYFYCILALSKSKSFKICVSSRPWDVFQENFEDHHHVLAVHELTAGDINNYTNDRLSQHPKWAKFSRPEKAASRLIMEITDRADGVFLWVFLVIHLERFFRHILMSVGDIYHEKMASTLLITSACESPLEDVIYLLHEEEYEDAHDAINTPIESYYLETLPATRINALSKGLRELRPRQRHYANGESVEQMLVEFLHRTVRDFLRTREMAIFLEEKRKRTFLTYRSIFKAHLALIKHTRFTGEIDESVFVLGFDYGNAHSLAEDAIVSALRYASLAMDEDEEETIELLDDLEWSLHIKATTGNLNFLDAEDKEALIERTAVFFRQYLLFLDLPGYISRKLSFERDYFSNVPHALLHVLSGVAPRPPLFPRSDGQMLTPKKAQTIQILLSNGHCLNEAEEVHSSHGGDAITTPWTVLLSGFGDFRIGQCLPNTRDAVFEDTCEVSSISCLDLGLFTLLLEHGADPNAHIMAAGRALPAWVEFSIFSLRFPRLFEHGERFLFDMDKFIALGAKAVVPSLEARAPGQGSMSEAFKKFAVPGTPKWRFCQAVLQRAAVIEPRITGWLGLFPESLSGVSRDETCSGDAETTSCSDSALISVDEKVRRQDTVNIGRQSRAWSSQIMS